MGIRVHKVLGYGLTDVETNDKDEIVDNRIRPDCFLKEHDWEKREKIIDGLTFRKYKKFIKQFKKGKSFGIEHMVLDEDRYDTNTEEKKKKLDEWEITNSIIHCQEYGLPHVLIILPAWARIIGDWYRSWDSIDYHEETNRVAYGEYQSHRVEMVNRPLSPYSFYMNKRTGRPLCSRSRYRAIDESILSYYVYGGRPANSFTRGRAKRLGFKDLRDAKKNFVPWVPSDVRVLADFADVFKSKKTVLELRPMIYTFWA